MSQNPILTLLKVAAFTVLAVLVGLSFWQENKQEDRVERIEARMSALEEGIGRVQARGQVDSKRVADELGRLARAVDALGAQGVRVVAVPGATSPRGPAAPDGADEGAPEHLTPAARALWGRYPDFLKEDPDWPENPRLDDPAVDPDGKVTGWYGSAPPDLNPLTSSDGSITRYVRNYCDDLWAEPHARYPYDYKPSLAIRVEVDPTWTEWTVFMRPGVRWHTPQLDLGKYPHLRGEHFLTARDWKFTMDLVMNPDVRAAHVRNYFQELESTEVVDDHCFVMRWRKKQFSSIAGVLNLIAPIPEFVFAKDENGEVFPDSQRAARFNDHWFSKGFHWCGVGPYVLVEFNPSSHMTIRRFDDYWGDLPAIREIERSIFRDRSLTYAKLESGEFTLASYLPNDWQARVQEAPPGSPFKEGRIGEHWGWSTQYGFIAWQQRHPIFQNANVRRAMTHACDRERIVNTLRLGKGQVVTGPQYVRSALNPPDVRPLPFDLERARALLAAEGWVDRDGDGILENTIDGVRRDFRVTAMIPQNVEFQRVFEILKEDLSKIGVDLQIEPTQWAQMVQRLNDRAFEVTALYWDTNGWDSDLYQIWHSSQVAEPESSNFINFSDPEVDRLIELARETFDPEERIEVQRAAHRRIHELQPYTFLDTIMLPTMYWRDRIAPIELGERWASRPFMRLFPLWVPAPSAVR